VRVDGRKDLRLFNSWMKILDLDSQEDQRHMFSALPEAKMKKERNNA